METDPIRVFCVDDDESTVAFYRIAFSIEPGMEFAGSLPSPRGLLAAVEQARPTVVLLDLLIPGHDTLEALAELHARCPELAVLVVSGLESDEAVTRAFECGASGFFLKATDPTQLTAVIRRIAAGERVDTTSRPARPPGPARPRT
jgi:DNA-binding NarL/FixJ family response regulator